MMYSVMFLIYTKNNCRRIKRNLLPNFVTAFRFYFANIFFVLNAKYLFFSEDNLMK